MRHHGLGGLRSPSLQYSPISSVATSWAGSSQISDLHLQSPISNVVILGRIQSDLRSPSPISNPQSRFGGPGEEGGSNLQGRAGCFSFMDQAGSEASLSTRRTSRRRLVPRPSSPCGDQSFLLRAPSLLIIIQTVTEFFYLWPRQVNVGGSGSCVNCALTR